MTGVELNRSTLIGAVVGLVIGILSAGLVASVLWPGDGARPVVVETPPVPPPRDLAPALDDAASEPAEPEDALEQEEPEATDDEEEQEEQEEQEEPSQAALLADAAPAGQGPLPDSSPVSCPAPTTTVTDAEGLASALGSASPGDSIALADGTYSGQFVTTVSGTSTAPIFLCGSVDAVLDGGDPEEDGYTFHLDGATHWRLVGFTVSGGQKGVMADGTVGSVIQGLTVTGTGDEAVHLRSQSTDNVVLDNTISRTGLSTEKYGEGVYIGSAVSNWCTYTDCEPDRSDRNVVKGNTITGTTSEPIDVKEGTTGGVLLDNVFDGSAMTESDTWVNLKGNNYLVQGNRGTSASENGFETHDILPGWGDFNVFADNSGVVDGSGWGIASWPEGSNAVACSNDLADAAEGLSNIPCV